ncbi:alpha/beta hydrolase [Leifsonia sp. SIMBA_070]
MLAGVLVLTSPSHAPIRLAASGSAVQGRAPGAKESLDPADVENLQQSRPDEVAAEWRAIPVAQRADAAQTLPTALGNLDGLPFGLRDKLNRRALKEATDEARRKLATRPSDTETRRSLQAYTAISIALKPTKPRRQLITLTADQPPLAAISVGDLDAADLVTWQVPGMGTYTTDMALWTLAAANLHAAQGASGAPRARAVIAWMGYVPPPPPPSIEASRGVYVLAGAPNLIRDVSAVNAVRPGGRRKLHMNIVAHSYGTTVAANALASADLGIDAFVMLASAGVEPGIGNASALHAQHVYAGEARRDGLADFGRLSRIDPSAPTFGATLFGVDGVRSARLAAVTGHEPILHSAWNDNPRSSIWTRITDVVQRLLRYREHKQRFGYLDRGTESLANTACATTPGATRQMTGLRTAAGR